MDALHFAYWLRGWTEINGEKAPTAEQWVIINDHLNLVFNKVTPDRKQPHWSDPIGDIKEIQIDDISPKSRNEKVTFPNLGTKLCTVSESPLPIC